MKRSNAIAAALIFVLAALRAPAALALVCMVPHNDVHRFSTAIPAAICSDAAAAYPEGNGKRTKLACRDGACPADTAIDVIWQNPGVSLPSPGLSGYAIHIRADSAFATSTAASCVFPTFPQPRNNFSPYWLGGAVSGSLCDADSSLSGWKTFGSDPFIGFSGSPVPESNFLMMEVSFASLQSTTTVSYDFASGGVYVIRSNGGQNISGCSSATYSAPDCLCDEANKDTDGCLELDVTYTPTPAIEACAPTGTGLSWAAPVGCLTATPTAAPTLALAGSLCRAYPAGTCGDAACPSACEYTVKLNGQTAAKRATTTIALPSVTAGASVSYTVTADCGGHPDTAGATVSGTAPPCDAPPVSATDSIRLNDKPYPFAASAFLSGAPLTLTGAVTESDSGETAAQAKVYVYFGADSGMSATAIQVSPNATGGFIVVIPATATANIGSSDFHIGVAAQDRDGAGSCFTPAGYQAAETSVCGYLPRNLRLNATATALVINNSSFVNGVACPADICASNPDCDFVIRAAAGVLKQADPTLPMVNCETGMCFAENALSAAVRVYDMKGPGDNDDKAVPGRECIGAMGGGFTAKVNPADVETVDGKKKVRLALLVPKAVADANRFPCDKQTAEPDVCVTTLLKNIEVAPAGGDYELTDLPRLPKGSGTKEVGNIYCDTLAGAAEGADPVDMADFNRLKAHFGASRSLCPCPALCASGQGKGKCYAAFADMNGDGKIDMVDYGILKTFFKKTISPAPSVMPKDDDGADLCTIE